MPRITQAVSRVANIIIDKLERTAGYVNHSWKRNPSWNYELILQLAEAHEGEDRVLAERFLIESEAAGWLMIKRHRYSALPEKVALICKEEVVQYETIYSLTGRLNPRKRRIEMAQLFIEQAQRTLHTSTSEHGKSWQLFCFKYSNKLRTLSESDLLCKFHSLSKIEILLNELYALLNADHPLPIREASVLYLGDSKKLELNQSLYLKWLAEITEGNITSLDDIGVQEKNRTVTLWGSWRLHYNGKDTQVCRLDYFRLPIRISEIDLRAASVYYPDLPIVTVENKESMESWAKLAPNALLISSGELGGFSHSAVINLIKSLDDSADLYHWGDADPAGFSILASLRERTGKSIQSIGMEYRPRKNIANSIETTLTAIEKSDIARLLESKFITNTEYTTLESMLEANSKGDFEQEGRPHPTL